MKKQKQSTKQTTPIQLAFNKKSHSISMKAKQEELFAPYKIQWKTNTINDSNGGFFGTNNQSTVPLTKQPLKSVQNNTGSRVFYQNMKNQLLNIKQDVQKLMMKQKTKDKQLNTVNVNDSVSSRKNSSHNVLGSENSGCVRTVSIKNKCQQQKGKMDSLYENVNSVLAGKIGESGLKVQQQNPNNNNTKLFFQSSCRFQKDPHIRTKSKSIADHSAITKAIYYTELAPQKDLSEVHQQPLPSPCHKLPVTPSSSSKPKLQLNIDLSSFDKMKQQSKMIDNSNNEKSLMIDKLKVEMNQLQIELSQKTDRLAKQCSQSIDLRKQIAHLTTQLCTQTQAHIQLQQSLSWHMNQLSNLHNHSLEQNNKINFLQVQLQKALSFIRQKEQQNGCLMRTVDEQNGTIVELGGVCEQLGREVKALKEGQLAAGEEKKLRDKLKMKQNQLYIYQQELKQAKLKIKQLKQQLQQLNQNHYVQQQQPLSQPMNNEPKPTASQYQQQLIDQTQKLQCQARQQIKIADVIKAQNERLKGEIQAIRQLNNHTQQRLNQVVKQNTELTHRICTLERDSQTALQEMLNTEGFQNIGQEISHKLSSMVDENYTLKNRISHLESNLQQITLKNRSLTEEVKIYEQKVSMQKDCVRRLKIEDWDNLTDERDRLRAEMERVQLRLDETKEFYEVEIMRKENCIFELKMQINEMIENETQNQQEEYHPNVKSVKHIKNLDSLLKGFKQMIDENISMKQEVNLIKKSILQ